MANLGLKEITTDKHGGQGPETKQSKKKVQAIDGIWASQGTIISQGGYLNFNDGPKSYHRLLWIKISHETAFVKNKALYRSPAARRLRLHHTIDQMKYTYKLILMAI